MGQIINNMIQDSYIDAHLYVHIESERVSESEKKVREKKKENFVIENCQDIFFKQQKQ